MASRRRQRRSRSNGFPSGLWWVLCGLAVLIFAGGYWVGGQRSPVDSVEAPGSGRTPDRQGSSPRTSADPPASPQKLSGDVRPVSSAGEGGNGGPGSVAPSGDSGLLEESPAEPWRPQLRPPAGGARISLVIDDLGRSLEELQRLESLGVPISYAVLPFESMTPRVVEELRRKNREILCHLPMEPRNEANPGPGALRTSMTPEELSRRTREALAAVPGAIGVNNHMGSSLTEDRRRMASILEELKGRKLFFLDSRTSAQSVGYQLAKEMGVPTAERQVFLDRDPDPEAIREQFDRLLALARERGAAIAIGHPYPSTLAVLDEAVPASRALGYEFVPVSFLLDSSAHSE